MGPPCADGAARVAKTENARSMNVRFVSLKAYALRATPCGRRLLFAELVVFVRCVFAVDATSFFCVFTFFAENVFVAVVAVIFATFSFWVFFAVWVVAVVAVIAVVAVVAVIAVIAVICVFAELALTVSVVAAVFVAASFACISIVAGAVRCAVCNSACNNLCGAGRAVCVDFNAFSVGDSFGNALDEVSHLLVVICVNSECAARAERYALRDVGDVIFDRSVRVFLAYAETFFSVAVVAVVAVLAIFVISVFFELAIDLFAVVFVFVVVVVATSSEGQGRAERENEVINTSHDTLLYAEGVNP